VIEKKKLLENRLQEWINSNPVNKEKYGNTLDILNEAYSNSGDLAKYTTYYLETFNNGIELIRFANTILQFDAEGTEQDKQDFINERLVESYKNYEPKLDRKVLPALMKLYADRVPKEYQPDIYQKIDSLFEGDYERYADWLFDNTQFTSLEELLVLLQTADTQVLSKDPAMELALSAADMGYELSSKMISFYENVLRGEREFMAALIEMDSDKAFYPDANFTQRLSYGSVAGYQPRDAVWYNYYSTTQGILEKQKPGDPEFNVQDYILKAILSGDFGRYSDENGELRVNFLSTNDITGGNSGSPVINGKGELIGLAFDGNWESLSGDILFEPEMQRMISVDILYVLYMLDKVMEAPHIVNELNLVD
jgi:energy-converting hydrogenase A subunit M